MIFYYYTSAENYEKIKERFTGGYNGKENHS